MIPSLKIEKILMGAFNNLYLLLKRAIFYKVVVCDEQLNIKLFKMINNKSRINMYLTQ